MAHQADSAAIIGYGTYKNTSATLAGTTTLALLCGLSALPATCKGFDLKVVSGTIYVENDGTTADADSMPFAEGEKWQVRNSREMCLVLRFFADALGDVRIALIS